MTAFYREAGSGPAVICHHANASSSSQWRGLMELLAPRFRVIAPDQYGSGKSPAWTEQRLMTLNDEVALLEPLLALVRNNAGPAMHLVGHSYGAAIALKIALQHPERVRSLALYEPTLFTLPLHTPGSEPRVQGIIDAVRQSSDRLAKGESNDAAEPFIDYWMGAGAWAAMPEERKPAIRKAIYLIEHWGHALCSEPLVAADFARLTMPVLYMVGERSPESARSVADLLCPALPNFTYREFARRGHMAPVTHPDEVNAAIAEFLKD